jgi:hypothetical protein
MLPDPIVEQLQELADAADESLSTLAAQMVRNGVTLAAKDGRVRPLKPTTATGVPKAGAGERAYWLEPYGGDPDWSTLMWGAIVALHGRYPDHLELLRENWWASLHHVEMLCALAVWREEIDNTGQDPRDEIAFHNQLNDYAQLLRQQSGGVTKTWKPGPPPPEWGPR